mmetsp:Transcript_100770/g.216021  ORF Transcript_100770/g.216021 Transcript_100770/m.216021 type:complete len:238 (-) Transcript_100770:229-942(-)
MPPRIWASVPASTFDASSTTSSTAAAVTSLVVVLSVAAATAGCLVWLALTAPASDAATVPAALLLGSFSAVAAAPVGVIFFAPAIPATTLSPLLPAATPKPLLLTLASGGVPERLFRRPGATTFPGVPWKSKGPFTGAPERFKLSKGPLTRTCSSRNHFTQMLLARSMPSATVVRLPSTTSTPRMQKLDSFPCPEAGASGCRQWAWPCDRGGGASAQPSGKVSTPHLGSSMAFPQTT